MFSSLHINNLFFKILIGMGNIQINFTGTFYVFRLLKAITTIWEGSNILKLYSVEVYQTCKFVTLEENIRQKW